MSAIEEEKEGSVKSAGKAQADAAAMAMSKEMKEQIDAKIEEMNTQVEGHTEGIDNLKRDLADMRADLLVKITGLQTEMNMKKDTSSMQAAQLKQQ